MIPSIGKRRTQNFNPKHLQNPAPVAVVSCIRARSCGLWWKILYKCSTRAWQWYLQKYSFSSKSILNLWTNLGCLSLSSRTQVLYLLNLLVKKSFLYWRKIQQQRKNGFKKFLADFESQQPRNNSSSELPLNALQWDEPAATPFETGRFVGIAASI